ncbi:MAG TPA: MBL fold metallo-hydrolase [Capsulimonadaceae bacterium]|nr:MBL fold metallo-hydrolase [Capsulimonadaceae bacterium]
MTHGTVIRWIGQACFLITTLSGMHVLIDPPHPEVGYKISANSIPANIVFVSHEHSDHNFVEAAQGKPQIVQPLTAPGAEHGTYKSNTNGIPDGVAYTRIFSYHDNDHGKERGTNTITVIQVDGLRICHMGDIGQLSLTADQLRSIGKVDVLMIPVGGFFTVDAHQALAIIDQLHPRVIIPMHYLTPALGPFLQNKLHPVSEFEKAIAGHAKVVHLSSRDLVLSPDGLPNDQTVYVMKYE